VKNTHFFNQLVYAMTMIFCTRQKHWLRRISGTCKVKESKLREV